MVYVVKTRWAWSLLGTCIICVTEDSCLYGEGNDHPLLIGVDVVNCTSVSHRPVVQRHHQLPTRRNTRVRLIEYSP